jgi:hypothetical protein
MWAAVLILLAGFGLRMWDLGGPSLWHDEIYTATRAQTSFMRGMDRTLQSGNQTPLYFASLHLLPHDDDAMLRYPSVLAGLLGIALLMHVVVRFYGAHDFALLAGVVLALNPYHVLLSRTARPYAYVFVISLAASYFFLLLVHRHTTKAIWAGFILSSMAAYITHYYTAALPLAQYALFAFILQRNRRVFRRWVVAQVVAAIPMALWFVAWLLEGQGKIGIGWIPVPGLDDIPLSFWNMMVGYDGLIDERGVAAWLVVPAYVIATIGLLAGLRRAFVERKSNRVNLYWGLFVTVPFALMFLASFYRPLYVDRYFTVFLPPIILTMLWGLRQLPGRAVLIGIVILTGLANILVTLESGRDERQGWRDVAEYIESGRQPQDGVLVKTPATLFIFLHYFEDDEMERAWFLFGPEPEEHPEDQFDGPVKRVWMIYTSAEQDIHRLGLLPDFEPYQEDYFFMSDWLLERRDRILERRDFAGIKVFLVDVEQEWGDLQ